MFEEPLYNIGAVTRITGVPIPTLRAWERRYGFPQSARTAGGHRLYSEGDIARLRWIKARVDSGMQTRQAIRAARALEADGRLFLPAIPEEESRSGADAAPASLRQPIIATLLNHDLRRADQLLGEMLAFHSPEDLTLEVIGPALNAIGAAWEEGRITVATEHLASNYLRHRLLMWMVTGPMPRPGNPIVLACAPGEWHEGSLLMLGVLLRRQGWPVAYLGQNVPFHDLADFVAEIRPPVVVLVAMRAETGRQLAEWPQWLHQAGSRPQVAYAGRAFVVQPELQGQVPGIYLGDSLQEGIRRLMEILQ
ncbi:MAG: MerR family transcriptional regulator [Anaerolineales bacterium]|nr:MerR family transcriptional regulator [Anaerolineales bacterium]